MVTGPIRSRNKCETCRRRKKKCSEVSGAGAQRARVRWTLSEVPARRTDQPMDGTRRTTMPHERVLDVLLEGLNVSLAQGGARRGRLAFSTPWLSSARRLSTSPGRRRPHPRRERVHRLHNHSRNHNYNHNPARPSHQHRHLVQLKMKIAYWTSACRTSVSHKQHLTWPFRYR